MKMSFWNVRAVDLLIIALMLTIIISIYAMFVAVGHVVAPINDLEVKYGAIQNVQSSKRVRATGYCLKGKMSSGVKVFPGACALSRDLVRKLKLCPEDGSIFNSYWGSIIKLSGTKNHDGYYVFMDLMPTYQKMKIDLWLPTANECYRLGFDKGNKVEVVFVRR